MNSINKRFHSLDALRTFALLLGVVFHSTLSYLLPPGMWAVGTAKPSVFLGWFAYYAHSFRMELFFLLAGFFAALVIDKRGVSAFIRDRIQRILLVFVLWLFPMKFLLGGLWVIGGRSSGWLKLPSEVASLSWWQLALGGLSLESWPNLQLTHLWFLYYLVCLSALFLAARWLVGRLPGPDIFHRLLQEGFHRAMSSRLAPLVLAIVVTPLLAMMKGPDVDTPDQSLLWNFPVLALYGLFFSLGWCFHRQSDLLSVPAQHWKGFLLLGLVISQLGSLGVASYYAGGPWVKEHVAAVRCALSVATSLTMSLSVFGWLGCFVRSFHRPSERIRYLADASYWIYLAHLPVVVVLQIGLSKWALPWWVQLPLLNVVALASLLCSYHWCVRFTWVGAWLNGRRSKIKSRFGSEPLAAESSGQRWREPQDTSEALAIEAPPRSGDPARAGP